MKSVTLLQGVGVFAMQLGGCILIIDNNEFCGDGELAFPDTEECDDGNNTDGDGCNALCVFEFCGDGIVNDSPFEQCDDGNNTDGDGCNAVCTIEANPCGDGFQDPGEQCDDGNNFDFDGCSGDCFVEQTGDVLFDYVVLEPDGNGGVNAAVDCAAAGVSDIHFMLGDDFDGSGTLEDNEIIQENFSPCNQADSNGNGTIEVGELGAFIGTFFAGSFDLFAIEFLDIGGAPIPWQTFDVNTNFNRFSFGGGFTVNANTNNFIPFQADPNLPQLAQELQAFFGF